MYEIYRENRKERWKEEGGNLEKLEQVSRFLTFGVLPVVTMIALVVTYFRYFRGKIVLKTQIKYTTSEKAKGVLFGKKWGFIVHSPTDKEGHIAVFGGSGLGKTSALLIPTLRSWTGTSFTIDISGDICKNVDMPHKLIYEPANPRSVPYNIFGAIDSMKREDDQNEALEQLAFLLMPNSEKMSDASRFFNTEGRKILTAALIAFYHQGMDFIPICEKIVRSSWQELFNEIDKTEYQKAIQYINSFMGASEQNTSGCKQSVDAVLKLFATNERIKRTIRRPKSGKLAFTPAKLEKYNVFVIIDDSKLELYAPILHIITAQSLEFFSNRSNDAKTTILFCLDEFASLGKMEITGALRKLRKKHVRIMMLTQSMADIDLIYGKDERMAMMNNFRFKVVLGADDTETQEYFAKLIGYKNVKKYSTSTSATQTTRNESESREFCIEPADLARLKNHLILLHPDGYLKLRKNFYYKKGITERVKILFKRTQNG